MVVSAHPVWSTMRSLVRPMHGDLIAYLQSLRRKVQLLRLTIASPWQYPWRSGSVQGLFVGHLCCKGLVTADALWRDLSFWNHAQIIATGLRVTALTCPSTLA